MLRMYFLQHWFNLSDPAVEEALYDSPTSATGTVWERTPWRRDAAGGVGGVGEGRGEWAMMLSRRMGGPTVTERGEYRVWLTAQRSETRRRRFLKLARAKEAKRLRIAFDENAPP